METFTVHSSNKSCCNPLSHFSDAPYKLTESQYLFIPSRVRGSVSNNNGFWIGYLDLLALLIQLHLIKISYSSSQSVTV
jgi:hypothetical protein